MKALLILSILSLVFSGCAEENSFPHDVLVVHYEHHEGEPDLSSAVQKAADSWNAACGREMVRVSDTDGVPIRQVSQFPPEALPAVADGVINGTTERLRISKRPLDIMIRDTLSSYDALGDIEHEMGHALGLDHKSFGIMLALNPPDKIDANDCALKEMTYTGKEF